MKTCSNCGAEVRESANFCTSCGNRFSDPAQETAASPWAAPSTPTATGTQETSSRSWGTSATEPTSASAPADAEPASDSESELATEHWSWGSPVTEPAAESAPEDQVETAPAPEVVPADAEPVAVDADTEPEESLADWAGSWQDDAAEDSAEPDAAAASTDQDVATPAADTTSSDTVQRAERAFAELRALIPGLAQPSIPATQLASGGGAADVSAEADELELVANVGEFDDLREVMLAARNDPRDIDSMMKLAAKADRLLELYDNRNNLAKTAASVAARLRESGRAGSDEPKTSER